MNSATELLSIWGVGTVVVIALLTVTFALAGAKQKAGFVLALYGLCLTIAGVLFCFLFQYHVADVLMLLTLREAPDRFAFRGLIWPGYGIVLGGLAFECLFFAKSKIARTIK